MLKVRCHDISIEGISFFLRWMAGNVSIEKDAADNWKPSKKKSRESGSTGLWR